MRTSLALALLAIACIAPATEAARRIVRSGDAVLVERGRPRELSHRVTTFGSTVRYGRALGGGPRGFAASASDTCGN